MAAALRSSRPGLCGRTSNLAAPSPRCSALAARGPASRPHARRGPALGPLPRGDARQRGATLPRRAAGGDDALPAALSLEDARGILGVGAAATFDDILSAKNRKLADADDDAKLQIEAAYDVLFSSSLKKRLTGELQVPTGVRFADVPQPKKRGGGGGSGGGARGGGGGGAPALLQKLPGGIGVATPPGAPRGAAAVQLAVFGGLMAWALGGALLESPDAQAADTGGLQLALAGAFSIYQLRQAKRVSIGRAAGVTAGCLVAGIMVGALLNVWLQVDIVPIGSFASPGVFVTEWAILAMALGSFFLV